MKRELERARKKKANLENKMESLQSEYEEVCKVIEDLENQEIIAVVRKSDITIEELMEKVRNRNNANIEDRKE